VIYLADTCHSGAIMGSGRRGIYDVTTAVKELLDAGPSTVIMTAAIGSSASLEDPAWGPWDFTHETLPMRHIKPFIIFLGGTTEKSNQYFV